MSCHQTVTSFVRTRKKHQFAGGADGAVLLLRYLEGQLVDELPSADIEVRRSRPPWSKRAAAAAAAAALVTAEII